MSETNRRFISYEGTLEDWKISENPVKTAISLLKEVMQMHADPESCDYNDCDKDKCAWCDQAETAISQLSKQGET